ncbi:glycerophosphodiester phosphodiesterase family protein [Blastococcus haudaquaticus]|uniref:glycerophosphodiester phosphodiesterase n=1 Tax=Blastococcus haudaquaticus TaxID=1938745 RepID=A0A286GG34_9ACTN|nr:glycerophosphodiester phosphodiesterase family protein [Blastococcus haudaquaticus]SOD94481.1 glycerophosphoryl diester phosphodiesterase [Blastococcus haudaquaticus]
MRATESLALRPATRLPRPVVIGHRGAPAYRPEHTTASFELAIELGAEVIEPDVVVSRDGVLVVRHESELSWSTDVSSRPEFVDRRTTKVVDDQRCTGWFTEDFTLAELRTLRAVERMPEYRPLNSAYDGHFGILTLAEVIDLARTRSSDERQIRVLAELKHHDWSAEQDLPMAELVTDELRRLGATDEHGSVMLQSFDAAVLRDLRSRLGEHGPQMVQLINDFAEGDRMVTPAGLREISTYAQGIAPSVERILRGLGTGATGLHSPLVDEAHRAALAVFCWTLRAENAFLPAHLRLGDAPEALGDAIGEARQLLALGVDGLITDSPDHAVQAVRELADDLAVLPARRSPAVPQPR